MKDQNRAYTCPIPVLYTVTRTAWGLCRENVAAFAVLKPKYTEQYIADALTAIDDAEKMKNSGSRDASEKKARIELEESATQVCINWQLLKRYMADAFAPSMQQAELQAAGSAYYPNAAKKNWTAVKGLILVSNSFIHDNLAALTANDNMPALFAAKFRVDGDHFMQVATKRMDTVNKNSLVAKDKVNANNAVYRSFMEMSADAQRVFVNNVPLRNQFTFSYLVTKVSGNGIGSIRGVISSSFNGKAVGDVTVTGIDEKYSAITNGKGRYNITRVAAGTYTFVFEKPGYDSVTQDVVVKPGTIATFDVVLTAQQVALKVA
jgi:hypothetical protein